MSDIQEYKGYTIKIVQDECPESPRMWDNQTTMLCFHKRYKLGDKNKYDSSDFAGWAGFRARLQVDYKIIVIKPLILTDHSGLLLSTPSNDYPQTCPWDSGQVGFIFVCEGDEFDTSDEAKERAEKAIEHEIATYNQYLSGDVWGYQITKKIKAIGENGKPYIVDEDIDSCSGIFGYDFTISEAKSFIDDIKPKIEIMQSLYEFKGAELINKFSEATITWMCEMLSVETIEMKEVIVILKEALDHYLPALDKDEEGDNYEIILKELSNIKTHMEENNLTVILTTV